ncbi:hypothetical protein [Henriciella pelagia]|uniref:hypothetical protein n=1 Tax=Henriciella pelagia TaxID=1977912 RepID=UPI003518EAE7
MQTFEFKPALMRGRDNWTLDSGLVTHNGEPFCSLERVTAARYAEMSVKHTHSEWFELTVPGRVHRVSCNMPAGDDSNRQFRALCAAVLTDLVERKPDLQVTIGAGGAIRWAMFIIGAVAAVFGLIVLASIGLGAIRDAKVGFALVFSLGFVAFGAWLAWSYRPWAPPLLLPVSVARDLLSRLSVNEQPATAEKGGKNPEQDKR